MKAYKTFQIRFYFASPVSVQYPYHPTLDALLAYAYVERVQCTQAGRDEYLQHTNSKFWQEAPIMPSVMQKTHYAENERIDFSFMPIAKDQSGIYQTTALQFEGVNEPFLMYYRRQFAQNQHGKVSFGKRKRQVEIQKGKFKSINNAYQTMNAKSAMGYVRGDESFIRNALQKITAIGYKRNIGHGKISNIEITKTDYAFDEVMRPYPTSSMPTQPDNSLKFQLRYQPPYNNAGGDLSVCWYPTPDLLLLK